MSILLKRANSDPEGISKLLEDLNKKNNGKMKRSSHILCVISVMNLVTVSENVFLY